MDFLERYKAQIVRALHSIDFEEVAQVIYAFQTARTDGRRIFVCGNGGMGSMASQSLCDMVKGASFNRLSRFRILALSDQAPKITRSQGDFPRDRIFIEQLKNF